MAIEGKAESGRALYEISGKIKEVPKVDDTLSKEGYAADARMTGRELARIEKKIDDMIDSMGSGE